MTMEEARATAKGYAWGQEDARNEFRRLVHADYGKPTASRDDRDGSYLFSRAYGWAQDEYNRGRRSSMMPVRDAYARWQATGGMTIEDEHGFEMHVLTIARSWIANRFPEIDVPGLTDQEVRTGMEVHYGGGWTAFRHAEQAAYYAPRTSA
jgi:hypothetical protein